MSVQSLVGGSGTFSSASGGKVYAYNAITTAPSQVAPANPARQKIRFHNPSVVDMYIAPAQSYNGTVLATLTPSLAALGGCFTVFANGGTLEISGECQGAWQALAASGTTNALTVMDSNLS